MDGEHGFIPEHLSEFTEILYVGNYRMRTGRRHILHAHKYHQLFYCLTGRGFISIGSAQHALFPDHAYLCRPGVSHGVWYEDEHDAPVFIDIKFTVNHDDLEQDLARLPDVFALDNVHFTRMTLKRIVAEGVSRQSYYRCRSNAYLTLLLTACIRELLDAPPAADPMLSAVEELELDEPEDDRFELVLGYIHDNLQEKFTLDDLCRVVHFNKSHLIKLFKEIYGITPVQYILSVRVERAQALLRETRHSIKEITALVGFQSVHYFSRAFKNRTGLSPVEYRSRHGQDQHIRHMDF